ncbi:D-2-hydroxyacid dehydrogenase [Microbacterium kribbense]|uniref:D-2-hydroxyacid dehydrogenase n=1 Tax=Microbacterium kribbense TaxID=433645 RepID=A0ABP7GS44_9MICO
MQYGADRLRVAVAAPLSRDLAPLLTQLENRIELDYQPDLLPPMRFPADFSGDPAYRRTASQQTRYELMVDTADALYGIPNGDPRALRRTIDANPGLRWVHTMAAGGGGQVRAANLSPMQLEQVVFSTSAGVHGGPLAEFALLGLLAGAKSLTRLRQQHRNHVWSDRWAMGQIAEQDILLIGLGGIGRVIAQYLNALGAHVMGMSRRNAPVAGVHELIEPTELASAIRRADGIVLSLPGTDQTNGLLGAELLSAVTPGVTIVNVGRGTVVDEPALIEALEDGRVGFAALDVFAIEPLPASSALWLREDVLISPHTAGLSTQEEERIVRLFASNATALLDGHPLRSAMDPDHFY